MGQRSFGGTPPFLEHQPVRLLAYIPRALGGPKTGWYTIYCHCIRHLAGDIFSTTTNYNMFWLRWDKDDIISVLAITPPKHPLCCRHTQKRSPLPSTSIIEAIHDRKTKQRTHAYEVFHQITCQLKAFPTPHLPSGLIRSYGHM